MIFVIGAWVSSLTCRSFSDKKAQNLGAVPQRERGNNGIMEEWNNGFN